MSRSKLRVALVGFGRMAAGYSSDSAMAKHYKFASHAQVLQAHPRLDWRVVVDNDPVALDAARKNWAVPQAISSLSELGSAAADIDLVVLATPPAARLGVLSGLPGLRAVLAEKPLGESLTSAEQFLDECQARSLFVQVNFWRRADTLFRELTEGRLSDLIGQPMAVNCYYGNGLLNNGSHMVDMVRMLFGECSAVQVHDRGNWLVNGPIPGDINPSFVLRMGSGLVVSFTPIDFRMYRENGLIIWGTEGKLEILNEGLVVRHYRSVPNRAMTGECEIANDAPVDLSSTVGVALYGVYENLLEALDADDPGLLHSPGGSAIVSARLVDDILRAANNCQ
jgi:predicted dehydrogenase